MIGVHSLFIFEEIALDLKTSIQVTRTSRARHGGAEGRLYLAVDAVVHRQSLQKPTASRETAADLRQP